MYENRTPEAIKREILVAIEADGRADVSTVEGSYTDVLVGPLAVEQSKVYESLNAVAPIAFVDESSGEYIDMEGRKYGITRKAGTRARAEMTLTGRAGVTVPAGTVFCTAEGLEFELSEDVLLTGGGDKGTAEAVEEGRAGNVAAGALGQMLQTIAGLDAWTNAAAAGGTDAETDEALFARIDAHRKRPATSGNPAHYEQWAMEAPGVGAAKAIPTWDGPGTVKVLLVDSDMAPVAEQIVSDCAAHIEEERPIGAAVTVVSAQALPIDVAAAVTLDGSATLEEVTAAFGALLTGYLHDLVVDMWQGRRVKPVTVPYNRVAYLLLDVEGVADYTSLTVCGGTVNVEAAVGQVPVPGEVALT